MFLTEHRLFVRNDHADCHATRPPRRFEHSTRRSGGNDRLRILAVENQRGSSRASRRGAEERRDIRSKRGKKRVSSNGQDPKPENQVDRENRTSSCSSRDRHIPIHSTRIFWTASTRRNADCAAKATNHTGDQVVTLHTGSRSLTTNGHSSRPVNPRHAARHLHAN